MNGKANLNALKDLYMNGMPPILFFLPLKIRAKEQNTILEAFYGLNVVFITTVLIFQNWMDMSIIIL